ncbi:hypothetical protein CEXT_541621 [Caerostris extrusa]|uniref:Uncharacterized protein n=1 Tax=Caerostris extrusa TaxID=172846 RepID=A0AAV4UMP5_CAEEX|nr:hypothetical protein CEXT_541621 [Caerostris extrusa]
MKNKRCRKQMMTSRTHGTLRNGEGCALQNEKARTQASLLKGEKPATDALSFIKASHNAFMLKGGSKRLIESMLVNASIDVKLKDTIGE